MRVFAFITCAGSAIALGGLFVLSAPIGCERAGSDPVEAISSAPELLVASEESSFDATVAEAAGASLPSALPSAAPRVRPAGSPSVLTGRVSLEASSGVCGKKPFPDCPLQGWMKANTSEPLAARDYPALSEAFLAIVRLAPPGYTNWVSVARDGARAAGEQNLDGVKGACRGCHRQYQKRYRAELRLRRI